MDPEAKRHHRQRGASLCLVLLVGATSSHAEADAAWLDAVMRRMAALANDGRG